MSPLVWTLAFFVTMVAATVQGTVGVGFAMISVPILALIDPQLAPVPQLIAAMPLTMTMAWRERGSIDTSGVGWIIGGRIPGAIAGVALLAILTQSMLSLVIGIVVVAAVAIIGSGIHIRRTSGTKFVAGFASGIAGLVASIGGPPIALIYSNDESSTIRSTLALIFTIGLSLSLGFRVITSNVTVTDFKVGAVLVPAVAVGYLISLRIKDSVPRHIVRTSVLAISAVAGMLLIAKSFIS